MRNKILLFLLAFIGISQIAAASAVRDKYNFNSEWLLYVGDIPEAKEVRFQDTDWKKVTLPRPFNEDEAFRLSIEQQTDTIMWYRKHFRLPANSKNKKVCIPQRCRMTFAVKYASMQLDYMAAVFGAGRAAVAAVR